jgi:prepilin-type N-terminal cleavage/methylation domain-containing protein
MRPRPDAFTLVELLIVILIVGVLAATAIPQFTDTSADAKLSALDQDLVSVRAAIELYHYQHSRTYPGVVAKHRTSVSGDLTNHSSANDAFANQMQYYSDASGNTCEEKSTSYPFGPYLRRGVPANPLPDERAATPDAACAVNVSTSNAGLSADSNPGTGWKASSATGEFIANHQDYDER